MVVDKSAGAYREVKSFGTSSDSAEIARLYKETSGWISKYAGQQFFDFDETERVIAETKKTIFRIERTRQNAPQTILKKIYDNIGFFAIEDNILRHLVIARICQPLSKVATIDYLKSYFDQDIYLHSIYRYMDKLYSSQRELVQKISVEHTMKILGGCLGFLVSQDGYPLSYSIFYASC